MTKKAPKEVWEEGTLFARHTDEDGNVTYQEHRCWNMTGFARKAAIRAAEVGGESSFAVVDEATYKKWVALNRRHR